MAGAILAVLALAAPALAMPMGLPSQALSGYVQVQAKATRGYAFADDPTADPMTLCVTNVVIHVEGRGTVETNVTLAWSYDEGGSSPGGLEIVDVDPCVPLLFPELAEAAADLINRLGSQRASASSPKPPSSFTQPASGPKSTPAALDRQEAANQSYVFTVSFGFSDGCMPSVELSGRVSTAEGGGEIPLGPLHGVASPGDICERQAAAGLSRISPAEALGMSWDVVEGILAARPRLQAPLPDPASAPGPGPVEASAPGIDPGSERTTVMNTLVVEPSALDPGGPHDEPPPIVADRIEASGAATTRVAVEAALPSPRSPSPPAPGKPVPLGAARDRDAAMAAPATAADPKPPASPGERLLSPTDEDPIPDRRLPPGHLTSALASRATAAGVAPSAVLLAGLAAALGALAWLSILALRGRIAKRDDLLRHALRRALYECLQKEPGLSEAELARLLGVHPTTVRHHNRLLLREGIVVARGTGKRRRLFPAGATRDPAPRLARAALAGPTARAVYEAVSGAPGLRASQIAAAIGTSHENACYHIRRLSRLGVVETREEDGLRRVYPRGADAARSASARGGSTTGACTG